MSERPERVIMPEKPIAATVAAEDVALSVKCRTGQRISMDIADEVWRRAAPVIVESAIVKLAQAHVRAHEGDVILAVHNLLHDRAWAEPIVKEAIRDAVREWIRDVMDDSPLGQMVRKGPGR